MLWREALLWGVGVPVGQGYPLSLGSSSKTGAARTILFDIWKREIKVRSTKLFEISAAACRPGTAPAGPDFGPGQPGPLEFSVALETSALPDRSVVWRGSGV